MRTQADCIDGKWMVKPVKSDVRNMCAKLNIDTKNLAVFDGLSAWSKDTSVSICPSSTPESEQLSREEKTETCLGSDCVSLNHRVTGQNPNQ